MNPTKLALPSLALGLATVLVLPSARSLGYTLLGQQLGLGQRDVRVYDNFVDPTADDNGSADPMFPGATGLELSLWKGMAEWGSGPHGDGTGDPTQSEIGSGNSNFDALWSGQASGVGGLTQNIVSTVSGCTPGVVAFAEGLSNSGWRIRFCDDEFVFEDGPGLIPGGSYDLQSVMTHEYGHALGLGHSSAAGSSMWPTVESGAESGRSLNLDDRLGIISIYGDKSATKPLICQTSMSGGIITITGRGFDPTSNTVWFTNQSITDPGEEPRVQVSGLFSGQGGTEIVFFVPGAARAGDVIVQVPGTGYDSISNAFPTDLMGSIGSPCPVVLSQVTPSTLPPLSPGSAQDVTLSGGGFLAVSSIELEPGLILDAADWTALDDTSITLNLPLAMGLGTQTLTLHSAQGSSSIDFTIAASDSPALQVGSGDALAPIRDGETLVVVVAGTVGSLHRIYYSPSPLPSLHPLAQFAIGNDFSQLFAGPTLVIGASGTASVSMPLSFSGPPTPFYAQSADLTAGAAPQFMLSNVQSTLLQP